jgi:hypothetical protein
MKTRWVPQPRSHPKLVPRVTEITRGLNEWFTNYNPQNILPANQQATYMTLINATHMSHQISQSKSLRLSGTRSIEEGLLLS